MSKRNTRNVSFPCNKRRFRDKKEALYSVRHIEFVSAEDHERPFRTYYCRECKGYHVTSKPRLAPDTHRDVRRSPGWKTSRPEPPATLRELAIERPDPR